MRRVLKSFGVVAPCALGVLGLLVGLSSLWEENVGANPATRFITQSMQYESYGDLFDFGSGEVSCGDGIVNEPEQCETNEQCTTGSSCITCMCQPNSTGSGSYTGNSNPGGWGVDSSVGNGNPGGGFNTMGNTNPGGGGVNSSVANPNWFIDLSLRKELLGISRSGIYRYRVTVSNYGNVSATNFVVKDYVSSNALVLYTDQQGLIQNNTITRSVDALLPGQSTVFVVELKKITKGDIINKAEVCDYEEASELQDADSNPCTMGPSGYPSEDDEDIITL